MTELALEQGVDELFVVETTLDRAARNGVHVRLHPLDAELGLFWCQVLKEELWELRCCCEKLYRVELLCCHVWSEFLWKGSEGHLDLFRRLDVFGFLANHEGHVLLQGHVTISEQTNNWIRCQNAFPLFTCSDRQYRGFSGILVPAVLRPPLADRIQELADNSWTAGGRVFHSSPCRKSWTSSRILSMPLPWLPTGFWLGSVAPSCVAFAWPVDPIGPMLVQCRLSNVQCT